MRHKIISLLAGPRYRKIKMIQAAIQKTQSRFESGCSTYTVPYLFSTENLIGAYGHINPQDKTILTVAASGDHIFDAYLAGAKRVDSFDFNLMQECVLRLKADLIRHMSYDEFTSFFDELHKGHFSESEQILSPFTKKLSPEARTLMTQFFQPDTARNHFFKAVPFYAPATTNKLYYRHDRIKYISNEENFNLLKERLPKHIDFQLIDAASLAQKITKNYDIIHLSNIMDYIEYSFCNNASKRFYESTLQPFFNHLTPGGTMVVLYEWGNSMNNFLPFQEGCFNLLKTLPTKNRQLSTLTIPSARTDVPCDTLQIIQKVR